MNDRDGGELGFGGGRDRLRRETRDSHAQYQSRFEGEKSGYSSQNPRPGRFGNAALPSRHLWVGNLSHGVSESELSHHFLRFGDLESLAFQPGRSYAFVNFARLEDAVDAIDALQGYPVAGNPLRIEFAKADKSMAQSHEENYSHRSGTRESSFSQKEFRMRQSSQDQHYTDSEKNSEPSPVLWVGFPASLKVDEMVLRRAFSPFGAIEKITAFPGRSYAFIRFESVVSACDAKDALHGKLFDNPRVHICFAKNESGSSNADRTSAHVPPSPHTKFGARHESSEYFRRDRNYSNNPRARSPHLLDSGDEIFDHRRFGERGYEYHSPSRGKRGHSQDFPQRFPHDEQWNLSDEAHFSHEPKRLRTGSFPPENELPEYPYSDREHEKHLLAVNRSDFFQVGPSDRRADVPYGYIKQSSDFPSQREWRESHDSLQLRPGSMISVDGKRPTPESRNSSLKEWKWEGVIAKGGTPVCRARCFPVGKVLDIALPEFLDCTARTGLDMLAKHYYQATNAWVVFFVPGSDADMGFYNEFMHYLEEKQRAAVSKLDETTTLFLVPPSNFSEKVLKVPGKLSMSGVVLRLEQQPGPSIPTFQPHPKHEDPNVSTFRGNPSYQNPLPPPQSIPPYFPDFNSTNNNNNSVHPGGGNSLEIRHDYPLHADPRVVPNWSSSQIQSSSPYDSAMVQRQPPVVVRPVQETRPGFSTIPGFNPEQLAQLASSLLGKQMQSANSNPIVPAAQNPRQPSAVNEPEHQLMRTPQNSAPLQSNQMNPDPQFSQVQHLQRDNQMGTEGNQNSAAQESDSDPQNRLQATLQLAAALLQQIQQGKGS